MSKETIKKYTYSNLMDSLNILDVLAGTQDISQEQTKAYDHLADFILKVKGKIKKLKVNKT